MEALGSDCPRGSRLLRFSVVLGTLILVGLAPPPSAALPIDGTWRGGEGDYTDGSLWDFDTAPASASYPDNDATDTFTALIDGGKTGTDSSVSLSGPARIDRLEIDAGDALHFGSGAVLTLVRDAARTGSGEIANDGTLALDGAGSQLRFGGDLALSGTGLLALADSAGGVVAPESGARTLFNNTGHRIEGAGTIQANRIENRGAIAATGTNALSVTAPTLLNLSGGLLEARGAGGLSLSSPLTNSGTVRVLAGSRLMSTAGLANERTGVFRVEGASAQASFASTLTNRGLIEVLNGARLTAPSLTPEPSATTFTRIANGGELALTSGSHPYIEAGILELDGGTLSGRGILYFQGTGVTVRGTGRIDASLAVEQNALLSPGLDGIGRIEIDGSFIFAGRVAAELGGTALGEYDRIEVSRGTRIFQAGPLPRIDVKLIDGFAPAAGDVFDLITTSSVLDNFPLRDLFSLPSLGERLALVPRYAPAGGAVSIQVTTLESLQATWMGGAGDYTDPLHWSFDGIPVAAAFPSNDDTNLFRVRIDGDPGDDSATSLATDVTVDRLEIGSGDALRVSGGLTLTSASNRVGSGEIANDGTLALDGSGAQVLFDGGLVLSGSGLLGLADGTVAPLAPSYVSQTLLNNAGHRIEGSGTIQAERIDNRGTIAATGTNPLSVAAVGPDPSLINSGTLEARSSGELSLSNPLTNTGAVRVLAGGRLTSSSGITNQTTGTLRVEGAGAQASFAGGLSNRGLIEVVDSARLTAAGLSQPAVSQPRALTRIAGGGELALTNSSTSSIASGVLELDAGTLSSGGDLIVTGRATLRGSGQIVMPGHTLTLRTGAVISPGLNGTGLLELDGDLSIVMNGRLDIDVGGILDDAFDRIEVAGDVELDGLVTVSLIDPSGGGGPFHPAPGDWFDVIVADSIADTGASYALPDLGGDLGFAASIVSMAGKQALRLVVIPEPGAGALLGLGLTLLAARRRPYRTAKPGNTDEQDERPVIGPELGVSGPDSAARWTSPGSLDTPTLRTEATGGGP